MDYVIQNRHSILEKNLDGATVPLEQGEIYKLIDHEAKLAGLSGADEAIRAVAIGDIGKGLIWDDLSLLVSLLSE